MAQQKDSQESEPEVIQTSLGDSGSEQNPAEAAGAPLSTDKASGPRTPTGKARSRRNAQKHSIFSNVALLERESRSEFERLLNGFRAYWQPKGMPEDVLVEKAAVYSWRYRRFLGAEASDIQTSGAFSLGFELSQPHQSVLDHPERLLRYEVSIERGFDRVLNQLERLQRMRRGEPVLPKLEVHHSLS